MSELSKWYHSIIIGDYNTWDSWHIVPTTRPLVNPPEVVKDYVEIAGADGALDFTETLTGKPVFKNREGSWEFIVLNDYQNWVDLYNLLLTKIHGREFDIVLEDEPDYVYHGRLVLNEWKSEEHNSKITIDYVIDPYKKRSSTYVDDWKWNDLTCNTDAYTVFYGSFLVSGTRYRNFWNPLEYSVSLKLTSTSELTMQRIAINKTYTELGKQIIVPVGEIEFSDNIFLLSSGPNPVVFKGNGVVTASYFKGDII